MASRGLPPRWKNCPRFGDPIAGNNILFCCHFIVSLTNCFCIVSDLFIPFKVPLAESFFNMLNPSEYFTPQMMISSMRSKKVDSFFKWFTVCWNVKFTSVKCWTMDRFDKHQSVLWTAESSQWRYWICQAKTTRVNALHHPFYYRLSKRWIFTLQTWRMPQSGTSSRVY